MIVFVCDFIDDIQRNINDRHRHRTGRQIDYHEKFRCIQTDQPRTPSRHIPDFLALTDHVPLKQRVDDLSDRHQRQSRYIGDFRAADLIFSRYGGEYRAHTFFFDAA